MEKPSYLHDLLKVLANTANSAETAITAVQLAELVKMPADKVSGALSCHIRNNRRTHLRRLRADKGSGKGTRWLYYVTTRAKVRRDRVVSRGPESFIVGPRPASNSIGIYLAQNDGKDVLLTFEQARAVYEQLKVVFG